VSHMHLMGMHLMGVHLMGVYLMSMHLIGVHLISLCLIPLGGKCDPPLNLWALTGGHLVWWGAPVKRLTPELGGCPL
jgi:hypothetical protein